MSEKIFNINGVEICTESFGNPEDPAVLLIMGACASMLWWDEQFCTLLAIKGRFVIRYDNRDVGRSVCYQPGTINYDVMDMTDDALGVLDAYGIGQAHIVGMSLGGMIAQILALRNPDRVLSITMMMSAIFGKDNPDLPPMSQEVLDYHAKGAEVDWNNEDEVVDYSVGAWKLLAGSRYPYDAGRAADLSRAEFRRAISLQSMFNHALLQGGEEYYDRMHEIRKPALVIHGTEDPVLSYGHGKLLAETIPGCGLVTLEGGGHEFHRNEWDRIVSGIIKLTSET